MSVSGENHKSEVRNPEDPRSTLAERVKKANRKVYNNISPEEYDRNESIFNEAREAACAAILADAAIRSGSAAYLDIATGTGNLLRIGEGRFEKVYAVDIADKLLKSVKERFPGVFPLAADAEFLPFRNESFNCVSCYAMLHHLLEHERLFRECHRVLKNGGTLYTDHDPNYFFNRFHRVYYRIRHGNTPGFGSETEELAEYHNTYSPGINPEELRGTLLNIGFSSVEVRYRVTDSAKFAGAAEIARKLLLLVSHILPARSFFTHFAIIAVK